MKTFWKHLPCILLILFVTSYGTYFSLFTMKRYEKMYAHYFDLGIMHQTVFNTYKGFQTGDLSRVLELTNPHQKPDQIKRMAIHNDISIALLAPFYFIYSGPETLLVVQSIVLAIGAILVFFITREVLHKFRHTDWIALVFSLSYLLYYPLQKANKFEFHMVTLTTTFLLAMYYAFLKKRYGWSMVFAIVSIFSKEQVGLTTAFFGIFILFEEYRTKYAKIFSAAHFNKYKDEILKTYRKDSFRKFAVNIVAISIIWILLSMFIIIPSFRGEQHFAANYFDYIKEKPYLVFYALVQPDRLNYLIELLSPVAFLSLFSPIHLLIALPELLLNLLSGNDAMRNTYFHYSSVITPFIFISAIYGFKNIANLLSGKFKKFQVPLIIIFILLICTFRSAYLESPLPYGKKADIFPWAEGREKIEDVLYWKKQLKDESLKIAASGQIAPFFTSRRYFYDFSYTYKNADYVVIDLHDVQYGFLKKTSYPAYLDLMTDSGYTRIYDRHEIEVFKKL